MQKALASRLCASADKLQSYAAFLAASEVVALRRGVSASDIRRGLTPEETHRIVAVSSATHQRDARTGRVVAVLQNIPAADADEIERLRAIAAARHEALYLASTVFGRGPRSLARAVGLSHTAVAKAVAAVEDRRSDPKVDRMLDEAELQLMGELA